MNTKTKPHKNIQSHFKSKLTDLNIEWFENRELADDISKDCLRLFNKTETDFNSVRSQAWYKRLWCTLAGGNTRQLAQGCNTLAKAQQLLLQVLQLHAQTNARSHALVVVIAQGLKHVEWQHNEVTKTIVHMADRIELIEKEVQLHRRQLDSNPLNEYTWNQEHKLLLYKLMLIGAMADNNVVSEEQDLLAHKLDSLELRDEYLEEAKLFEKNPYNIDEQLSRLDSYNKSITMFKHLVGILCADGRLDPKEKAILAHFSSVLNIRQKDKDKITDSFASIMGGATKEQIFDLISKASQRKAKEPEPEEYKEIDKSRRALEAEEEKMQQEIADIRSGLEQIGPVWAQMISSIVSTAVVNPICEQFEVYGGLKEPDVKTLVAAMTADDLLNKVKTNLNDLPDAIITMFSEIEQGISFLQEIIDDFKDMWEECIQNDGGWETALAEVNAAGTDLVESCPSGTWEFVKGGALGYAGAALLGPVGWIGAAVAAYCSSDAAQKKYERAANRWDSSVSALAQASERWQENVAVKIEYFGIYLVKILDLTINETHDPAVARLSVEAMYSQVHNAPSSEEIEKPVKRRKKRTKKKTAKKTSKRVK